MSVNYGVIVWQLADQIGPHICVLKTHMDIVQNFAPDIIQALEDLSSKHKFLIFEDRFTIYFVYLRVLAHELNITF